MSKGVYRLNIDCGRSGNLEGVFVAKKEHVKILIESGIQVYFGEVLGKHSEVFGAIEEKEITLLSDLEEVVRIVEEYELSTGYNPFGYSVTGSDRDDFQDIEVSAAVEILEKELSL